MENSAYVPSSGHLNSPALVVFSQAAGGLQDALRIQRPFNPQTTVKEESLDAHMSEDGDATHGQATDNDSPGIHDDNRGFRIGPLFGGGFTGSGAYAFSVPGLPPAAHALAKTSFLFDHGCKPCVGVRGWGGSIVMVKRSKSSSGS
ncbi:hypothetical protein TcasGA2_TC031550 [Tribolium castaneum]|uniref:Uncharacterized protein n=1 Tax=Tribolium castaneum TaxID=7070 RepID=A0A139WP65_TRICA|nr:hypothetical protein TcasGA2_TC031550 [Tribolium castaneum]